MASIHFFSHVSYPNYTKPLEFTTLTGLITSLKTYTCYSIWDSIMSLVHYE